MGAASEETRRVLVVEDEPILRELLTKMLRWEGYAVVTADNGRDALALLDGSLPHLIVLDLVMPIMDGFAFRAQQLLSPRLAAIPVIVLSAAHPVDRAVLALHPHAWFSKPFDVDQLLESVSAAMHTTA